MFSLFDGLITCKKMRHAKKQLRWIKKNPWFLELVKLSPGDLVYTCNGYNEHVKSITDCVRSGKHRHTSIVYDFDIETDHNNCSALHCGVSKPKTKESIVNWFLQCWGTPEGLERAKAYGLQSTIDIVTALKEGKREVFNEDGTIKEDYL